MLSGVRPCVFGAAGLLAGREFHEFDARVVGIVEVKLPFAVATHLGLFVAAPTVLAKLLFRRVDVRDSESHVVHDAESVMVSVGGNVEHVFDPVRAIGDLHVDPVGTDWIEYMLKVPANRSEEHTPELQSQSKIVCRPLLGKKKTSK